MNVYYSPAYTQSRTNFDTTRKAQWIVDHLARYPMAGITLIAPTPLTINHLLSVHTPEYVHALRTGHPESLAGSSGFAWDDQTLEAVCASNGGVVDAVTRALTSKEHAGSLSSGLHHAYAEHGGGFCTVNGLAVAARAYPDHRMLILDLDAHCGGGTYSLIRQLPNVTHLDICTTVYDEYFVDYRIDQAMTPQSLSSFDVVDQPDMYFERLAYRLGALEVMNYDVVVYNAGMDVYPTLSARDIQIREHLVFAWANARRIPVAFVLAGGYTGPCLTQAQLVRLHLLTVEAAAHDPR